MPNDKQSPFNELSEKDDSILIHERNLQVLATDAVAKAVMNYQRPS